MIGTSFAGELQPAGSTRSPLKGSGASGDYGCAAFAASETEVKPSGLVMIMMNMAAPHLALRVATTTAEARLARERLTVS